MNKKISEVYGIQGISPIRIVFMEDHPLLSLGLETYLANSKLDGEPIELVGIAQNRQEVWPLIQTTRPDVLILDIWMTQYAGKKDSNLPLLWKLKKIYQELLPVIIFTCETQDLELLIECRAQGVQGMLFKHEPLEHLLAAICSVYTGLSYFSSAVQKNTDWPQVLLDEYQLNLRLPRLSFKEASYLYLALCQGPGRDYIAEKMRVTVATVSEYRSRAFCKLKISQLEQLDRASSIRLLKHHYPKLVNYCQSCKHGFALKVLSKQ